MIVYEPVSKKKVKSLFKNFENEELDIIIREFVDKVKNSGKYDNLSVEIGERTVCEYDKDGIGESKNFATNAEIRNDLFHIKIEKDYDFHAFTPKTHYIEVTLKFNGKTGKEADDYKTLRKIIEEF